MDIKRFGGYRLGTNLPVGQGQGPAWEQVARTSRWGAPVIELNVDAEKLGRQGLSAIKQQAQANDLIYTWHIPPNHQQSGELAVPDERKNEFARKIMEQAMKSAMEVGARHITFHGTHMAQRLPNDQMYIYDKQQDKLTVAKKLDDLNREDNVKLLNESKKAQLRTQLNQIDRNKKLVNGIGKTADLISQRGLDDANAYQMAAFVNTLSRQSGMVGLQPDDIYAWQQIQLKTSSHQPLSSGEKQMVKDYANRVRGQISDYNTQFDANLKQLNPLKGEELIEDGAEKMIQNVAKNIGMLDKNVLKQAVNKGLSLGFENLGAPVFQLFTTPEDLDKVRELTINELVKQKKLSRKDAEKLIGFTFDISHANTSKYIEFEGKKFASPKEFLEQLKGPIKHVHASSSMGIVDGHLPLGQGELEHEEIDAIQKALEKSGFSGTAVHELGGAQLPVMYGSSVEYFETGGSGYFIQGKPAAVNWGPSYLSAAMTDPLLMGQKEGYFHESFADIF